MRTITVVRPQRWRNLLILGALFLCLLAIVAVVPAVVAAHDRGRAGSGARGDGELSPEVACFECFDQTGGWYPNRNCPGCSAYYTAWFNS